METIAHDGTDKVTTKCTIDAIFHDAGSTVNEKDDEADRFQSS